MKKILVVLIVMLTAGCAGTGMRSSGYSSGSGSSDADRTYSPNFSPAYEHMDSSFHPYFGG